MPGLLLTQHNWYDLFLHSNLSQHLLYQILFLNKRLSYSTYFTFINDYYQLLTHESLAIQLQSFSHCIFRLKEKFSILENWWYTDTNSEVTWQFLRRSGGVLAELEEEYGDGQRRIQVVCSFPSWAYTQFKSALHTVVTGKRLGEIQSGCVKLMIPLHRPISTHIHKQGTRTCNDTKL